MARDGEESMHEVADLKNEIKRKDEVIKLKDKSYRKEIKQKEEEIKLKDEVIKLKDEVIKLKDEAYENKLKIEAYETREKENMLKIKAYKKGKKENMLQIGKLNERNQYTTLKQYLEYSHQYLFQTLKVQLNKTLAAAGGTTRVNGKYYPSSLLPWVGFTETQRQHFDILKAVFKDERSLPSWENVVAHIGDTCRYPLATEEDLKTFEFHAIERPVENIIKALATKVKENPGDRPDGLDFDVSPIFFTFHNYGTSGGNSEGGMSDGLIPTPLRQNGTNKRVALGSKAPRSMLGRRCVHVNPAGDYTNRFVIQYKAAHKFPVKDLQQALGRRDLFQGVMKRKTSCKQTSDNVQNQQDRVAELVAMILTETFHDMVEFGLEYSYLTSGKAVIFLWIKKDNPKTLYYHMITPYTEVNAEEEDLSRLNPAILYDRMVARQTEADDWGGNLKGFDTAVAQVASFCLLTFRSTERTEEWKKKAKMQLNEWPTAYADSFDESSGKDSNASSHPPGASSSSHSSDPTYVPPRGSSNSSCQVAEATDSRRDDRDHTDSNSRGHVSQGQSRDTEASVRPLLKRKQGCEAPEEMLEREGRNRKYCTQACLLGLKRGGELDEHCPNVSSHATLPGVTRHPIQVDDLAALIREQSRRDRDQECYLLDAQSKNGKRVALLKLTLVSHGYTFLGKGVGGNSWSWDLRNEAMILNRLERLQGIVVPVFLGKIDLEEPLHVTAGQASGFARGDTKHMMLLSWGGRAGVEIGLPERGGGDIAVVAGGSQRGRVSQ
ncbi:hypothetical protein B7494_g7911 [Chlorociboria aeruginascens]|nr:hypothetical protein B7494_g7911 [Chlorociboria aeruginascens]